MMAWRSFMFPLMVGAVLGAYLMWLCAGVGNAQTVALVLLAIQIPILVWDVMVSIRLDRIMKQTQKDMEEVAREWYRHNAG
jgi:Flp pilus assembly protein TadB